MSIQMDGIGLPNDFSVNVLTTNDRGHSVETCAELCADKVVLIAPGASKEAKDQAMAFRDNLVKNLIHYMKMAIASDRTTVYNMVKKAEPELAEILRRL
jgi:hypothetical protein